MSQVKQHTVRVFYCLAFWCGVTLWSLAPVAMAETDTFTRAMVPDFYKDAGVLAPNKPRAAPAFSLPSLDGTSVQLADYRGKLVLLNFWATWCIPCIKEMPLLQNLARRMAPHGVEVLAISVDVGGASVVRPFVAKQQWQLPILLDPLSDVSDSYLVRVMPTTYLIGPDGTILGRAFGAREWDGPEFHQLLRHLLKTYQP